MGRLYHAPLASLVQDTIAGGEGQPTPMLLVTSLHLRDVERHVKETNAHLPSDAKLFVSLHNGSRPFVVNGPPRSLHGLGTNLRKIRIPIGADQSKMPARQRQAVFNMRFLIIGVPYHNSGHLQGVGEKMVADLG
jgi:fatty acid synthase subunit alpha